MVGLTGAVLAGGHSLRFGSNKALYTAADDGLLGRQLHGRTFLQHALDTLRPLCDELLISASKANATAYGHEGVRVVVDEVADCGPLGGLVSLLSETMTPWLLLLTCDMPFVSTASLQSMLGEIREDVDAISAHQFPLLIRRDTLYILRDCLKQGDYRVRSFLSKIRTRYVDLPEQESMNINQLNSYYTTQDNTKN
ncbi:MAG: molybdenum cofactor guanylyltransferase [Prevotella sp.]